MYRVSLPFTVKADAVPAKPNYYLDDVYFMTPLSPVLLQNISGISTVRQLPALRHRNMYRHKQPITQKSPLQQLTPADAIRCRIRWW